MEDEQSSGRPRLPIGETIKQSYAHPVAHLRELIRLGWIPAIVFGGVSVLLTPRVHRGLPLGRPGWSFLAGEVIESAVSISWSVAWMRLVLGIPAAKVRLRFGRREWKYAGWFWGLILVGGVLFILVLTILLIALIWLGAFRQGQSSGRQWSLVLPILIMVVALTLTLFAFWYRVILILPAIAIDQFRGLRSAWRQTRGFFWQIAVISVATSVPASILIFPIMRFAGRLHGASLMIAAAVFGAMLVVLTVILHTAFALIYRQLVQQMPPASAALAHAE